MELSDSWLETIRKSQKQAVKARSFAIWSAYRTSSSTSTEMTTGRTSPRAHVRRVDAGIATFRNRFALPVAAMASSSLWS